MFEYYLEDLGYKTGEVYFPGLDITVELAEDRFFRNAGLVDDINSFLFEIGSKFGYEHFSSRLLDPAGECWTIEEEGIVISIIYVNKDLDASEIVETYGHESVHALIGLGYEKAFLDLAEDYGLRRDLVIPWIEEVKADLGGLIALDKRRRNIRSDEKGFHPTPNFMTDTALQSNHK